MVHHQRFLFDLVFFYRGRLLRVLNGFSNFSNDACSVQLMVHYHQQALQSHELWTF